MLYIQTEFYYNFLFYKAETALLNTGDSHAETLGASNLRHSKTVRPCRKAGGD